MGHPVTIDDIRREICHFLALPPSRTSQSNLRDELCLDSLDIAELMVHLEQKYQIEFVGEKLPPIETIDDLAQLTQNQV